MAERKFTSYRYSEGRTGTGQLVRFSCGSDDVDLVRQNLAMVRSIDLPVDHKVNVSHGGYGQYSRYEVEHLQSPRMEKCYAGGGMGFIEGLEIKDPPDGRHGIVINEHQGPDSKFTEFETAKQAISAFEGYWGKRNSAEYFAKLPGFMRTVKCGLLVPWFYAIGEEELVGDYTFPHHLQQDPVFRFGRQFVVNEGERGLPRVRTCLGARVLEKEPESSYMYGGRSKEKYLERTVFWEDGSSWRDHQLGGRSKPRPLEQGELWITEAVDQFQQVLAGGKKEFEIAFADGSKFVGKVVEPKSKRKDVAGRYQGSIVLRDGSVQEGWFDFTPTEKTPTVEAYVVSKVGDRGGGIETMELERERVKKGEKKWAGVFYDRHSASSD